MSSETEFTSALTLTMLCTSAATKAQIYKKQAMYFLAKSQKSQDKVDKYTEKLREMADGESNDILSKVKSANGCSVNTKDAIFWLSADATTDGKNVDLSTEDSEIVGGFLHSINGKPIKLDCVQVIPAMTTWRKIKDSNIAGRVVDRMVPHANAYFKGTYPNLSRYLKTGDLEDLVSLEAEVRTIDVKLADIIKVLGEMISISAFADCFKSKYPDVYSALI